mmetsp:Transcript_2959/g.3793  ORF Transcript_2959/g.3793 Transcript_2959/m.3793 type:complete len:116 (-) Transcript_2959:487-834(-)
MSSFGASGGADPFSSLAQQPAGPDWPNMVSPHVLRGRSRSNNSPPIGLNQNNGSGVMVVGFFDLVYFLFEFAVSDVRVANRSRAGSSGGGSLPPQTREITESHVVGTPKSKICEI